MFLSGSIAQRQQQAIAAARARALQRAAIANTPQVGGGSGGGGAASLAMPIASKGIPFAVKYLGGGGTATGAGGAAGLGTGGGAIAGGISNLGAGSSIAGPVTGGSLSAGGSMAGSAAPHVAAEVPSEFGAGAYAGPAAAAAIAAIMYHKLTSGSGINEPVRKRSETAGAAQLASDIISGRSVDKNNYTSQYGLPTKYNAGGEEVNYNVPDLWHLMHKFGRGVNQEAGSGDSSGYTDTEIDNMLYKKGLTREGLAKALGLDEMPDWNKQSYGDWFSRTYTPTVGEGNTSNG